MCTDVQASLVLFWWQKKLITFKCKVDKSHYKQVLSSTFFIIKNMVLTFTVKVIKDQGQIQCGVLGGLSPSVFLSKSVDNLTINNKVKVKPLSCWKQKWLVFATSIEPGQPAHLNSLTRFYTVGWLTSRSHLDIPKMKMDSAKNRRWIILFQKFSRLRVKRVLFLIEIHTWLIAHGILSKDVPIIVFHSENLKVIYAHDFHM